MTGQPYAFDVATFGSSCGLTQLTRYSYRNLLEGRPAYDTVQVVNGERIQPPPADAAPAAGDGGTAQGTTGRRCSRLEPTSLTPIEPGTVGSGTSAPGSTKVSGSGSPSVTP